MRQAWQAGTVIPGWVPRASRHETVPGHPDRSSVVVAAPASLSNLTVGHRCRRTSARVVAPPRLGAGRGSGFARNRRSRATEVLVLAKRRPSWPGTRTQAKSAQPLGAGQALAVRCAWPSSGVGSLSRPRGFANTQHIKGAICHMSTGSSHPADPGLVSRAVRQARRQMTPGPAGSCEQHERAAGVVDDPAGVGVGDGATGRDAHEPGAVPARGRRWRRPAPTSRRPHGPG